MKKHALVLAAGLVLSVSAHPSALEALDRGGLDRNIALISSTSGGRVTAAACAIAGALGRRDLDEKFRRKQNMAALVSKMVPRLFVPGANRTTDFAVFLDRLFSDSAPRYENLIARGDEAPVILLKAADMDRGKDRDRWPRAERIPATGSLAGKDSPEGHHLFLKDAARELLAENSCSKLLLNPSWREPCVYANLVENAPRLLPGPTVVSAAPPPSLPPLAPMSDTVTFAADAFFDFTKDTLKPEGHAMLDDLVSKMLDINLEAIIAVGHTDTVGGHAYNQKLSVRRAESVKNYLVSKGVEKNRVYTEGKGEKQPVADTKTAEGRAKNRRVVIEVVGKRKR